MTEPALLRSGRFDDIVHVAKPDAADRAAIVRLCCRRVPMTPDVVGRGDFLAVMESAEPRTSEPQNRTRNQEPGTKNPEPGKHR